MNLDIQLFTITVSFLYGIFFSITMNLCHKIIYNNKLVMKILFTFIFVIVHSLIYFNILLKINYGIIHIYGILSIIIGFILSEYIKNKIMKKFFNKNKINK